MNNERPWPDMDLGSGLNDLLSVGGGHEYDRETKRRRHGLARLWEEWLSPEEAVAPDPGQTAPTCTDLKAGMFAGDGCSTVGLDAARLGDGCLLDDAAQAERLLGAVRSPAFEQLRREVGRELEGMDTLVLASGGIYGFTKVGFLEFLEACLSADRPVHRHFRRFAGASIGALLAVLLAARVPVQVIKQRLLCWNVDEMVKVSRVRGFLNLCFTGGMVTGELFERVLDRLLLDCGLRSGLAMRDLGAACAIAVSRLDQSAAVYITAETDPDMLVREALAISMAYPSMTPLRRYRGAWCTDGGTFAHLPLAAFGPELRGVVGLRTAYAPCEGGGYRLMFPDPGPDTPPPSMPLTAAMLCYSLYRRVVRDEVCVAPPPGTRVYTAWTPNMKAMEAVSPPQRVRLLAGGRSFPVACFLVASLCAQEAWRAASRPPAAQ